jgi:hypothetical protein
METARKSRHDALEEQDNVFVFCVNALLLIRLPAPILRVYEEARAAGAARRRGLRSQGLQTYCSAFGPRLPKAAHATGRRSPPKRKGMNGGARIVGRIESVVEQRSQIARAQS